MTDLSTAKVGDDVYIHRVGHAIGFRRTVEVANKRHIAVKYISGLWYFNLRGNLLRRQGIIPVNSKLKSRISLRHTISKG